jgi:hypothetical protein
MSEWFRAIFVYEDKHVENGMSGRIDNLPYLVEVINISAPKVAALDPTIKEILIVDENEKEFYFMDLTTMRGGYTLTSER